MIVQGLDVVKYTAYSLCIISSSFKSGLKEDETIHSVHSKRESSVIQNVTYRYKTTIDVSCGLIINLLISFWTTRVETVLRSIYTESRFQSKISILNRPLYRVSLFNGEENFRSSIREDRKSLKISKQVLSRDREHGIHVGWKETLEKDM